MNDAMLQADGFEDALLGVARRDHQTLLVYSTARAIAILEAQMEEACLDTSPYCDHWVEATEYFEFNVVGSWMGEGTPLWLDDLHDDEE